MVSVYVQDAEPGVAPPPPGPVPPLVCPPQPTHSKSADPTHFVMSMIESKNPPVGNEFRVTPANREHYRRLRAHRLLPEHDLLITIGDERHTAIVRNHDGKAARVIVDKPVRS